MSDVRRRVISLRADVEQKQRRNIVRHQVVQAVDVNQARI